MTQTPTASVLFMGPDRSLCLVWESRLLVMYFFSLCDNESPERTSLSGILALKLSHPTVNLGWCCISSRMYQK